MMHGANQAMSREDHYTNDNWPYWYKLLVEGWMRDGWGYVVRAAAFLGVGERDIDMWVSNCHTPKKRHINNIENVRGMFP